MAITITDAMPMCDVPFADGGLQFVARIITPDAHYPVAGYSITAAQLGLGRIIAAWVTVPPAAAFPMNTAVTADASLAADGKSLHLLAGDSNGGGFADDTDLTVNVFKLHCVGYR